MTFGLSPSHWSEVEKAAITPLKQFGASIFVFGSRARGDNRPFSDLDLVYESAEPVALAELGKIKEALEASSLPIKVDIAWWNEIADAYRAGILKDRVRV